MAKKFDVVVTTKYVGRDGQEKKKYQNIGFVNESDKGMSVKIESIPVGWDGWASFFDPKPRDEQAQKPVSDSTGKPEFNDDINF